MGSRPMGQYESLIARTVITGLAAEGMEGVDKIISGVNEELRRA